MNWRIEIEDKQVRKFCAAYAQPVSKLATVLMETALDAGADAVEVTTESVRFRVGGQWRDADRVPEDLVPSLCAFLLLVHSSGAPGGTVALHRNGDSRKISIDVEALKLSFIIE